MCDYMIISGYDEFEYAKRAILLGVKAYLLKPIDDQELAETLDKLHGDIAQRKEIENGIDAIAQMPPDAQINVKKSQGERYIDAAMDFIRQNLAQCITVKTVADQLCISESYLSKLFKRKTGRSFLDTLTCCRMQEAERLLQESNLRIYEIANCLGYQDTQYFSNLFRKYAGINPSEYKR